MKKLLNKVNQDIQDNNLGTAIKRVKRFINRNRLLVREAKKRKEEILKIHTSSQELLQMAPTERYANQPAIERRVQVLADNIEVRKLWPLLVSGLTLIATIFAIIQFMWPDINEKTSCPEFDKDKCSLVITKFNAEDQGRADFIAGEIIMGINGNEILSPHISIGLGAEEPCNGISDEEAIDCIKECKNQFSIYGSYYPGKNKLEYHIVEDGGNTGVLKDNYSYLISPGGLEDIKSDLIAAGGSGNVIKNSICSVCDIEAKQPGIYAMIAEGEPTDIAKQAVYIEAAKYHNSKNQIEKAILDLENIENIADNKYAVFAVEKAASLSMKTGKFASAFERQSRYINKVNLRLEDPERYGVRSKLSDYQKANLAMHVNRGMNVYNHVDEMGLNRARKMRYIETAISDFNFVDPDKYQGEIDELRKRLEELEENGDTGIGEPDDTDIGTMGTVIINLRNAEDESLIPNASIMVGNYQFLYDNMEYYLEKERDALIGQRIEINAPGFHSLTPMIQEQDLSRPMNIFLRPENQNPERNLRITVFAEDGSRVPDMMVVYNDHPYSTDMNGTCEIKDKEESFLGSYVALVTGSHGRPEKTITQQHLQNGMIFRLSDYPRESIRMTGVVIEENEKPLRGVRVESRFGETITDIEGQFSFEIPAEIDMSNELVAFGRDGYEPKRVPIPDIMEHKYIVLKEKVEIKTYRISGNLSFCKAILPEFKQFNIGDKRVKFSKNGNYRIQIEAERGTKLDIGIPEGYALAKGEKAGVTLLDNTNLTLNIPIEITESFPKSIIITGIAIRDGKPLNGVTIGIIGQKEYAKTANNGSFRLQMQWTAQCHRIQLYARSTSYGAHESGNLYPVQFWNGSPSRVDFGNINFKYLGPYIE